VGVNLEVSVTVTSEVDLWSRRVPPTHDSILRSLDMKLVHGFTDFDHAIDEVGPYYLTIALDLGRGPRDGVDDAHLLWG